MNSGKMVKFMDHFRVVALSKLLLHTLNHNDSRLKDITVQGDQIVPVTNGIRTRSKAAQGKYSLSVLLLHTLNHNDSRLKDITVQGDQIVPVTNGIRTRSKAAQGKYSCIYYCYTH